MKDRLWEVDDVAEYLGIPKSSVYKLTSSGQIPHKKVVGRLRFAKNEIDEWLALLTVSPVEQLSRAKEEAGRIR